jgi:hypothetical protein
MRAIQIGDEPECGVAFRSILVSLLGHFEGRARDFDHVYDPFR